MSASDWLSARADADEWIPNSNKITVDSDRQYARELFQRPQARVHFFSYMGQLMLQKAGGYIRNLEWSHKFDQEWGHRHSAVALCAGRNSQFPPCELQLWKWVRLYYPAWLGHFWPNGQPLPDDTDSTAPPERDPSLPEHGSIVAPLDLHSMD